MSIGIGIGIANTFLGDY